MAQTSFDSEKGCLNVIDVSMRKVLVNMAITYPIYRKRSTRKIRMLLFLILHNSFDDLLDGCHFAAGDGYGIMVVLHDELHGARL